MVKLGTGKQLLSLVTDSRTKKLFLHHIFFETKTKKKQKKKTGIPLAAIGTFAGTYFAFANNGCGAPLSPINAPNAITTDDTYEVFNTEDALDYGT